jgi:glucose/arabinose dehydrogenase
MRRSFAPAVACLLAVCLALPTAAETQAPAYRLTTVAEGLELPWGLAFLPDGAMLVTERPGRLRRIDADGTVGEPLAGVPPVFFRGQGGLLDVALHPNFQENRWVYLSYAHGDGRANATRIARGRLGDGGLDAVAVIFTVTPTKDTPQHYGGSLAFLPDGTLLVTTGDGFDHREQAQNLDSLLGKTLRITDEGGIPADNPFVDRGGAAGAVWTYGHRNPQGLAVDPRSGRVYQHEHGPRGGDELNLLQPGRNYGWPMTTFGLDYTGGYVSPFTDLPGVEPPLRYWTPSIAPSGLTLYLGAEFPEWRGDLLLGALVDREVRRLDLQQGRVVAEQALFAELGERIRNVREGPDGRLYLLTDSEQGRLIRVQRR